uniref:Hydroxysteroid 11-beta-dehydrogenase 1-like protein n=1 Tax=Neogobius melanostomus TaxID=47308 RepID=A0A8C6T467_9GOBI
MRTLTKIFLASISVAFIAVKWNTPTFEPESLRGARVLVTGREKVLQQVVEKCLSLGAQKALYIAGDMATESDPDKVVEFSLEKLGGLDYLVLNHIGPTPFSMWKGDIEHTRWLMQVNFFSYVQMAWKALPSLEQSKGSLVIVSSLLGKLAGPFTAPYTSTKFAVNGFFGSLQHELAMNNSNVSLSICTLGLIDTDSAMEKVRDVIDLPAAPATEAALNIIKTGSTRQAELYYPWNTYIVSLTKDWIPAATNYIIRNAYNYIP